MMGFLSLILIPPMYLSMRPTAPPLNPVVNAEEAVHVSAAITGGEKEGEYIVAIRATIVDGYHIYSITQPEGGPLATRIQIEPLIAFEVLNVKTTPPPEVKYYDFWPGLPVETHRDGVTWTFTMRFPNIVKGYPILRGTVFVAVCSDKQCFPPVEIPFVTTVR